jgi:hypothetical protein
VAAWKVEKLSWSGFWSCNGQRRKNGINGVLIEKLNSFYGVEYFGVPTRAFVAQEGE